MGLPAFLEDGNTWSNGGIWNFGMRKVHASLKIQGTGLSNFLFHLPFHVIAFLSPFLPCPSSPSSYGYLSLGTESERNLGNGKHLSQWEVHLEVCLAKHYRSFSIILLFISASSVFPISPLSPSSFRTFSALPANCPASNFCKVPWSSYCPGAFKLRRMLATSLRPHVLRFCLLSRLYLESRNAADVFSMSYLSQTPFPVHGIRLS